MLDLAAASDHISQMDAWKLWFDNVDISTKTIIFDISVRNWGRIGKGIQALAALTIVLDIIGAPALRRFGSWLRSLITLARARYLTVVSLQLFADRLLPKVPVLFRLDHVNHYGRRVAASVIACCTPGIQREQRRARVDRILRRDLPILLGSKKGVRRLHRWRARVFPASVEIQRIQKQIVMPAVLIVSGILAIATFIFAFRDFYPESLTHGLLVAFFAIAITFIVVSLILGTVVLAVHLILPVVFLILALLAFVVDLIFVEPTAWIIGHPKNENLIKALSILVFLIGFYFDLLAS